MSDDVLLDRTEPWTEDDYLALDMSNSRIELIDGNLLVTPPANGPHQRISKRLTALIDANAADAGKELLATIGVRLAPGRIVIPDLAVGTYPDFFTVVDASAVALACEVTSPGNAFNDRDIKKYLYAAAKIPWYLHVEPDTSNTRSRRTARH